MEQKTRVTAEEGKQEIVITRTFDLSVELLFQAYTTPDLVEQWMGNKVLKMESRAHGSYQFETKDGNGNVLFSANGVIHEFLPNERITRTFEMENTGFPVQIEYLDFTNRADGKSDLKMHIVFKSVADRDNLLKMPFAVGINMAHNQLQKVMAQLK